MRKIRGLVTFHLMRKRVVLPLLALALVAGGGWYFRGPLVDAWNASLAGASFGLREKLEPDPAKYEVLAKDLERWRKELAARHRSARNGTERSVVEKDARILLEHALPEMMRCWLGTPWDYSGTAKGPGQGRIACGYFVATVLKDAGFQVDRYRLAQQPSGNILRSFLPKDACTLTVGKEYGAFADEMATRDPGVYVVGLDTHVAFLVVGDDGFRFIHSSGSKPWCVVDEGREEAEVLRRSNWRMTGNLTADKEVIRRWLKGGKIEVKGA